MDTQDIIQEWQRGEKWRKQFTRDFQELDELADGGALQTVQGAPRIGAVYIARAVRQIPQASIQQMPTFSAIINGTKLSIDAIISSFVLRSVVFNEDTFGTGILSTMQNGGQAALTRGYQPLMAQTGKIFNQFGTVLRLLHYEDVVIEPGVFDASDSSYYHVRTRVTKSKLKSILKSAKSNPDTQWNVEALQELYEAGPSTRNYNSHMSTARSNPALNEGETYEIITRFGVGPYYDVMFYSPQLDKPLMEYKSKSKFGFPMVSFLVIDPAPLLPFGVSRARLASPYQNYANNYLQSTAKMMLLNADPPVLKKGLFTSATPLRRNALWETLDPNADVQIKELSNTNLQQFQPVLEYMGNQIEGIMGVGDAMAKTNSAYQNSAAVQARQQMRDLGSAQVTMILENAIRQYALTALDLYLSEQSDIGETQLIVDDEAKNAINQIEGGDFVGSDNVVNVDWTKLYERIQTMSVSIDMSISKQELEDKKRADLQDLAMGIRQNSDPQDPRANQRVEAIENEMLQSVAPNISRSLEGQEPPQNMPAVGGEIVGQ